MKSNIKRLSLCLSALMLLILASPLTVLAAEEEVAASAKFYGTFWSLVPPLVAIALALITKEVYSSLFVGILVGALFYSNFNFCKEQSFIFFVRRNDQRSDRFL